MPRRDLKKTACLNGTPFFYGLSLESRVRTRPPRSREMTNNSCILRMPN
jgi:hypothetical protein